MPAFGQNNNGVSTTFTTDDTAFFFLGGEPFGPWVDVAAGWTVTGAGLTNGVVKSVTLTHDDQYNANFTSVVLYAGAFTAGAGYGFAPPPPMACLLEGTRVLSPSGYTPVEALKGSVTTASGRVVACRLLKSAVPRTTAATAPYSVTTGGGKAAVKLSPGHMFQLRPGVWIKPWEAARLGRAVQDPLGAAVTYYHVECPDFFEDDLLLEGGLVAESYASGALWRRHGKLYEWNEQEQGHVRRASTAVSTR
jgi:hypothetical protein